LDEENLERLKNGEKLECQKEKPKIFEEGYIRENEEEVIEEVCRC
jgi:hypothetical protein